MLWTALLLLWAQIDGAAAFSAFDNWRKLTPNKDVPWERLIANYRSKLIAGGLSAEQADKTITIIEARDEGVFYDPLYDDPAGKSPKSPSKLLAEAVADRKPGRALDVGMGQGRNAIHLARLGWDVTGFDTSKSGVEQARKTASAAGLKIRAVVASDEEFDFGTEAWDLIAIVYPIEKRSVFRVRQALKPGGIVVIECGHQEAANAPFEYGTNELLEIFQGFRIRKYEDKVDLHEWAGKRLRMVRLIAEK